MPSTQQFVEYERIWVEGLNRGDVSAADRAFAPDCVVHITGIAQPIRGVEAWKQVVGGLLAAIPDLHFTLEDQIVAGDKVAMRWTATGTQTGPFGPILPTGKPIAIEGLIFDRVVDGKVAERWEQWDQSLMLQQIGS